MKRKICLAIETTGFHLGVSLFSFEPIENIYSFFEEQPFKQSDSLIPKIKQVLSKNKISVQDLDLVAVDMGPGSFTGVRVGVAVARAISQMLSIPAIGVSSLEAMAEACLSRNPEAEFIASSIPALHGELYFSVYKAEGENLREMIPACWKKDSEFFDVISKIKKTSRLIVCDASKDKLNIPHSDAIARIAIKKFLSLKKKPSFSQLVPLYLQPMWAERTKK